MAKSKQQKEQDLSELNQKLDDAKGVVLAEYRGTPVKDMDKFRRSLEKEDISAKVYKVTLLRKALESRGIDASSVDYKLPVIVAMSNSEETLPAKVVKGLTKEIKTIGVLAGVMENHLITKTEVLALADLPSKQDLRAKLVGTINAPVSGFVNVLAGNIRGLMNVLNAMAQKS